MVLIDGVDTCGKTLVAQYVAAMTGLEIIRRDAAGVNRYLRHAKAGALRLAFRGLLAEHRKALEAVARWPCLSDRSAFSTAASFAALGLPLQKSALSKIYVGTDILKLHIWRDPECIWAALTKKATRDWFEDLLWEQPAMIGMIQAQFAGWGFLRIENLEGYPQNASRAAEEIVRDWLRGASLGPGDIT